MKALHKWTTVLALGAGIAATSSAFAQADLQLKAAKDREAKEKNEERKAEKAERREEKHEREELNNMPQPARRVLRAETENAKDIDYFRIKEDKKDKPTFGAKFTRADGHQIDLRVDRDGNVLSRTDLTAQAAAARAPATPAPVQPVPAPTPTPTPAPTSPTAQRDAPKSGDPMYRRLQPNEVPANIKTVLDREAQGGQDVKYYRTKYGDKLAYEVKYDDAKGVGRGVYVDDAGAILTRNTEERGEATTASNREPANRPSDNNKASANNYGRVELDAIPRQAQTQLRRLTEGGKDVKFYRTKYGNDQAFEAKFTGRDGKDHSVYVDENGKILSQKDEGSNKK